MKKSKLLVLAVAFLFPATVAAQQYNFQQLPDEASGISNAGTVLVGGRLWQGGQLTYPPLDASASGIGADGSVAGSLGASAAVWQNGTVTLLPPFQVSPDASAVAMAVNSGGVAVGSSTDDSGTRAVQWSGGTPLDLSAFTGGAASAAVAINDAGQVVINASPDQFLAADRTDQSFVYQNGNVSNITPASATGSYAYAINGSGGVVGTAYSADGTGLAFKWQSGQTELAQSLFPSISGINVATAINASGDAVGFFMGNDPRDFTAFLWQNGGAPIDLNTLITPIPGLHLYAALGINDSGQIVGGATMNGVPEGFVLTPVVSSSAFVPEPASLTVLALGATALLRRRRKR